MDYTFQQVYLHSFIAFCYQKGTYSPNDILKPLVKKSIATYGKTNFSSHEIHDEIKRDFEKDFPCILVEKELLKLVHDGILIRNPEEKTSLTYSLVADLSSIKEEYIKSQDETTFFLEEFKKFLSEKQSQYANVKISSLMKRFEDFCSENVIPIMQYLGGTEKSVKNKKSTKEIDSLIESFFEFRVKDDERLSNEFENIFNGINLLKILENCSDNLQSTGYSIGNKVFYLDTNILLRMLGLQSEYLNVLGTELLELLHSYNFELKVFKDSLDELFYLLRGYKRGYSYFIKGRDISHVYQTLKNRDVEPFQIDDLIDEIPEKLKKLGITIDTETLCIPTDYGIFDKKISEFAKIKYDKRNESETEFDISDYSSHRYLKQAKHDLESIERIRTLRNKSVLTKFEDAQYYFITAESNLLKFNKNNYHYTEIDETIGDYTISFLLYFYKPNNMKGISLRGFIAANHSNNQLSIGNWISYVNAVNKKYKDGTIDKSQFGYLLTRTILNNEKFISEDLNDIVNDGLTEFNSIVSENEDLKKERFRLLNDSEEKDTQLVENAGHIAEIENDNNMLKKDVENMKEEVQKLKQQMKFFRKFLFVLFTLIFIIGVVAFFSNKILGSLLTVLSIIATTLNIADYFKKWIIQD